MFAVPSRLNKKPIRRKSWSSLADAAHLNHPGARGRSQSVNPDLVSQTIHEISYKAPPLNPDNNKTIDHELTPVGVVKKVSSKLFVTEKVKDFTL